MAKRVISKGKPIPKFKSYGEEANFWDTHSPLDYGYWKEVKMHFAKPLQHILGIRFDSETLHELDKKARAMGVGPSTLARMWVMEKLNKTSKKDYSLKQPSSSAILHKVKPLPPKVSQK